MRARKKGQNAWDINVLNNSESFKRKWLPLACQSDLVRNKRSTFAGTSAALLPLQRPPGEERGLNNPPGVRAGLHPTLHSAAIEGPQGQPWKPLPSPAPLNGLFVDLTRTGRHPAISLDAPTAAGFFRSCTGALHIPAKRPTEGIPHSEGAPPGASRKRKRERKPQFSASSSAFHPLSWVATLHSKISAVLPSCRSTILP